MSQGFSADDLIIDFINDHIHYSRRKHRGKSELIAKALGISKGIHTVFDLTCGLAQDAFFLSQLGFNVKGFERSEVLYQILTKALLSAKQEAPNRADLQRFSIEYRDSIQYLQTEEFSKLPKQGLALYIDPMFPEKRKTALPRKEMQIFRTLVGEDEDSGKLLDLALNSGCERVVVKRPLKSEPLGPGVIHRFEGTTVRFDLYAPRSQS